MESRELMAAMQAYGLDENEARLYFHLSRLGPSRAADVAMAAGTKRTDAYRLLDRLADKGFASKSLERPTRYIPRPAVEALQAALEARFREADRLQRDASGLAELWPKPVAAHAPIRQRLAVHQGRDQIDGVLARMVESASEDVLLATSHDGLARIDAAALGAALQARAAAGVMVRVLARPSAGVLPFASLSGVRLRQGSLPSLYQCLIVDQREVALFVGAGRGISGSEETVVVLTAPDVVLAQKALFDQSWSLAAAPGEAATQLQVVRGRWVRTARLKSLIDRTQRRLVLRASASETTGWARQGVLAALEAAAARGVAVTVHAPAWQTPLTGVRVEPCLPAPGLPGLLAAADDAAVLVGLDDGDTGDPDDEWGLWASHPRLAGLLEAALGRPRDAQDADSAAPRPEAAGILQNRPSVAAREDGPFDAP